MSKNIDVIDTKPTTLGEVLYQDFSATLDINSAVPIGLLLCLTYANVLE